MDVDGDFKRLNNRTVDDLYLIPNMQDFAAILDGKTIFSKIDLICGYHQIPLNESDIPKTAITTVRSLRVPFWAEDYTTDVTMPRG